MYSWKPLSFIIVVLVSYKDLFIRCQTVDETNPTSSLTPYLNLRYELASGDNNDFEDLMEYIGVGWLMRKAIIFAKPTMELKQNGDEFTLSSESFFKNIYTKFKFGEEFEEKTPDGRFVMTKFTEDGNKLIQTQRDKKKKVTTIVREFKPDEVIVTAKVDNLSCVRVYKLCA